ncbi:MAG: GTP cyclohydrolase I FolE [Anderseniella sp.]
MDAVVKRIDTAKPDIGSGPAIEKPSEEQALEAVRTLISWAGDDPDREGLLDTPKRVLKAYSELFSGYKADSRDALQRTFEDVGGYDDIVLVRNIEFFSHCEHHMVPFQGHVHIAYLPTNGVVGLSKLARVVEVFSRRLQTQENLTAQIVHAIDTQLDARGVAVMVEAVHNCMTMRGVQKRDASTLTTRFTGDFKAEPGLQARFMEMVRYRQPD